MRTRAGKGPGPDYQSLGFGIIVRGPWLLDNILLKVCSAAIYQPVAYCALGWGQLGFALYKSPTSAFLVEYPCGTRYRSLQKRVEISVLRTEFSQCDSASH